MQYTNGNEQPLISVIVPIYNTVSLLPRSIDSILNQTHSNLELILVNDGSTDGSGDVCDEYAKRDTRVRVIHRENAGQSAARNAGWAVARGEWIGQVDSDDYIDLEMYEKLLRAALSNNTPLAACGHVMKKRNNDDKVMVFPNVPPKITVIECLEWRVKGVALVSHWAMLYHRKLINKTMDGSGDRKGVDGKTLPLRYDTVVHKGADRLFVIEALLRAPELAYIPEALYTWDCTREDNTSNSPFSEKNMTWFIGQKKIIELIEPISPIRTKFERRRLARYAFSAMIKTLFSKRAHINDLYPQACNEAKGYVGYLLTDKNTKITSRAAGCIVYLFPRFARATWRLLNSLNKKVFRSKRIEEHYLNR